VAGLRRSGERYSRRPSGSGWIAVRLCKIRSLREIRVSVDYPSPSDRILPCLFAELPRWRC
jgi:hypothetical protein